jgi:protein involved in polysaccharide export with SLBB domain
MDQNQSLSPLVPSTVISNGTSSSEYILGPGDTFNILVQPQTKYGLTQVSIDQDGRFEYPHVGTIQASGKTVSGLRDELAADLAKYCINPDVSIELTALRPQVIYVTGGVKSPKILDVRAAPNVAKAITLADGAIDQNELAHVSIFREGKVISCDIYGQLVNGQDNGQNINLQPGDLVVVPMNTAKFAVVGAVNTPGVYPLTPAGGNEGQTRLADALAAAGGAQRSGASIHGIQIVRTMPDGSTKVTYYDYGKYVKEADVKGNPVIQNKDLIFVPDTRHSFNPLETLGYLPYIAMVKGMGL